MQRGEVFEIVGRVVPIAEGPWEPVTAGTRERMALVKRKTVSHGSLKTFRPLPLQRHPFEESKRKRRKR